MAKIFRILLVLVGAVLVFGIAGFFWVDSRGVPRYEVGAVDFQHQSHPQAVARGKKLVSMLCANCHADPVTGLLTGTRMLDAPPEFGVIYSRNITGDSAHGIGDWTDGELVYLLRTGIKRDGQYVPPYMAKLPLLADEDMNAIIAFLRSDDPLVAADPKPDWDSELTFLTKLLSNLAWKPLPMPAGPVPMPPPGDEKALGRYLALNLDCFSCHSADFKTNGFGDPERSAGFFGGGNKPLNRKGEVILTGNLTPDPETGIGRWSRQQFIRAVKYLEKPGEPPLRYPMAPYPQLTDEEAGAIYTWLQTIPPIKNKVDRFGPAAH